MGEQYSKVQYCYCNIANLPSFEGYKKLFFILMVAIIFSPTVIQSWENFNYFCLGKIMKIEQGNLWALTPLTWLLEIRICLFFLFIFLLFLLITVKDKILYLNFFFKSFKFHILKITRIYFCMPGYPPFPRPIR